LTDEGADVEIQVLRLPAGWECRMGDLDRKYFVDHTTKTTQWESPEKVAYPVAYTIAEDDDGRTVLHLATKIGNEEVYDCYLRESLILPRRIMMEELLCTWRLRMEAWR
jgi:ankyrin repeat protein